MTPINQSLLILCIGNPARGDDAIGPLIAQSLRDHETTRAFTIIEDFQLQPELVEDLCQHRQVLVIDAHANASQAITIKRVVPAKDIGWCSHALSPEQLAGLYQTAYRRLPPEMVTLGISATCFELGTPPQTSLLAHIPSVTQAIADFAKHAFTAEVVLCDFLMERLVTPDPVGNQPYA